MARLILIFFTAVCVLNSCWAQVINYGDCTDSDPKDYCRITEVRLSPCAQAGTNKACNLKKGKTYSLQMDFTALQPIETMKSCPYWASAVDLPFVGMNDDACSFTQCPIAQNNNQTYDFRLKVAKSLPRGQFDVKWKFWTDNEHHGCCARFYLKLS